MKAIAHILAPLALAGCLGVPEAVPPGGPDASPEAPDGAADAPDGGGVPGNPDAAPSALAAFLGAYAADLTPADGACGDFGVEFDGLAVAEDEVTFVLSACPSRNVTAALVFDAGCSTAVAGCGAEVAAEVQLTSCSALGRQTLQGPIRLTFTGADVADGATAAIEIFGQNLGSGSSCSGAWDLTATR